MHDVRGRALQPLESDFEQFFVQVNSPFDHGVVKQLLAADDRAKAAREAFITSATNHVMPVVRIDGAPIGNGAPGLTSQKLRSLYYEAAEISSS